MILKHRLIANIGILVHNDEIKLSRTFLAMFGPVFVVVQMSSDFAQNLVCTCKGMSVCNEMFMF